MTPFETAARAAIANRRSPATREDYTVMLDRWLVFVKDAKANPSDPPAGLAAAFRDHIKKNGRTRKVTTSNKKGYSNETVRNCLAALSAIYRTVCSQRKPAAKWNPFDPKTLAWPPASTEGKTEAVPQATVDRMFAACAQDEDRLRGLRDAALLRLYYETGLRRMSIVNLRRDKLFQDGDVLVARVQVKGSGGEEQKKAVIPKRAAAALAAWLEVAPPSVYVFPGRIEGSINLATANRIVAARGCEAGDDHVHPHRFRAAFITEAFSQGLPWREIQESVHHADPRSTQRYDRGLRGAGVAAAVAKARQNKTKE